MLIVHHLQYSRSTRILWLLEELGIPYEARHYVRDPKTMRRTDDLKAVHPLGKAPVLEDGSVKIAESGAIIDYVITRYGGGRLAPAPDSAEWPAYIEWLHFAEGSAMLGPVLMMTSRGRSPDGLAETYGRESTELALSYIAEAVKDRSFLVGDDLTGADIQIFYVLDFAKSFGLLGDRAELHSYLERLVERPAFRRAIEVGGPVSLPRGGG